MADHDHQGSIDLYGLCLVCARRGDLQAAEGPPPADQLTMLEADRDPPPPAHLSPDDAARLGGQARRVITLMVDGTWRTLGEIATATGDPEASISARLRDLRRADHGGYTVDSRLRDGSGALHEYRVTLPRS